MDFLRLLGPFAGISSRQLDQMLCSAEPTVVARAADSIARGRRTGHGLALLRTLRTWANATDPGARRALLAVLDALVQTDAVVPAVALAGCLHGATAIPAFVLFARASQVNERELLADFVRATAAGVRDLRWLAAGNLLCAARTPGFAAALLRDVSWTLTLARPGSATASAVSAIAPRLTQPVAPASGFPEPPQYTLTIGPERAVVLAPGAFAVGYVRDREERARRALPGIEIDRVREGWLSRLGDGVAACTARRVVVHGTAAAGSERARIAFLEARRRLFTALLAAGELSPAEAIAVDRPVRVVAAG